MDGSHNLRPAYVARVAASAQPGAPRPLGRRADHCEHLERATETRVVVRATPWQTERRSLLVPWRMAVLPTPGPEGSHKPAPPCPNRLALAAPVSTAWRGPIGGKAETVEAPRAPCRWLSAGRRLARPERRLFGLPGPADAGPPLRPDGPHAAGVGFSRAAEDTSIGTTRPQAPALQPGWPICDKPGVHDPMQADL
jgi:hypothetical protein